MTLFEAELICKVTKGKKSQTDGVFRMLKRVSREPDNYECTRKLSRGYRLYQTARLVLELMVLSRTKQDTIS